MNVTSIIQDVLDLEMMPSGKIRVLQNILIHRSHVADDALHTIRWFRKKGWKCPYHFYLPEDGRCEQMAPLNVATHGAWRFNDTSIQIGVSRDLRNSPPRPLQAAALLDLCSELKLWKPHLTIDGHYPHKTGRSADPTKVCPGHHMNIGGLAIAVADRNKAILKNRLTCTGVVLAA